ncbi:uncharacterized protein LOC129242993 isoform X1 [Anastrepha obliqua]|uniref:uncharacterized protein LOC129242993 isoform X1 n=1 Tax=Anastrepha obliqua TaxID=95512 RepID=UPI002409185E|nr:uncharacterized protein LOC129242993 isoform X1 [Anastrepha obliqua]
MEKQPDELGDVTNEPLPSMSEPMEVQDAVTSTLATPFAQPIITASKSKAQKQREYRQRIAASRTPAQAAVASTFATPFAEPITAAPKTKAQIQREYRQRIATSQTPAQKAAARKARNARDRNNRLRQTANLVIASGSLEATTAAPKTKAQIQREYRQRIAASKTPAQKAAATTVQPSTYSAQIEVQAQSTWNTKWASLIEPTRYERERASMKNKPRKVLNLEERVLAIRLYQENPVYQRVASVFKCSWEQIRNVIANRDDILRYYGECQTVNVKDSPQYVRNKKINFLGNVTYEFIKRAYYHHNATLNDEVIRQRALQFRDILKIEQFHPNKVWIADFKKVYNIDWQNLAGLIICGVPPRSLENKDLIEYCTRMVTKAISLIGKIPKQLSKKEIKNADMEDEENEAASAISSYGDNESDSMLTDQFNDVPVVNEIDDFAGMYLDAADIDEEEINEDEEGPTINYADYDGTDEMPDFNAKDNLSAVTRAAPIKMSTKPFLAEVQIKQERPSRSRSRSPPLLSPLTVASGTSTQGTGAGSSAGVKRKRTEAIQSRTELSEIVKRERVSTYTEAMRVLCPLEDFATQQEDFHALNLLMQLVRVFEKGANRNSERRGNV